MDKNHLIEKLTKELGLKNGEPIIFGTCNDIKNNKIPPPELLRGFEVIIFYD